MVKITLEQTVTIIIPTLNAAAALGPTLAACAGFPVLVADGGSTDGTPDLARQAGARVVAAPRGRGTQLAAGAAAATTDWLLFLHADTRPGPGWAAAVRDAMATPGLARYFAFALDDASPAARRLERRVAWRCRVLALPYGDQGLLISRRLYDELGGYGPQVLMEDVDLVRRIGRRRLELLDHDAVTSAERYVRGGYLRCTTRNLACLGLWYAGMAPERIARIYR